MAKELPYFKFVISEYLNGDIYLEDYKTQGVFMNICAYYWHNSCDLTLTKLKKKYRDIENEISILSTEKIIKVKGEKITINFLDEQWNSKEVIKVINRVNGSKGGRPIKPKESEDKPKNNPMGLIPLTETKAKEKPNITNIDNSKENKIKEDVVIVVNQTPTHNFFTINQFELMEWSDEFSLLSTRAISKTVEETKKMFDGFIFIQKGEGKLFWKDETDAKKHFINWLKKQPKPQVANKTYKFTNNNPSN